MNDVDRLYAGLMITLILTLVEVRSLTCIIHETPQEPSQITHTHTHTLLPLLIPSSPPVLS